VDLSQQAQQCAAVPVHTELRDQPDIGPAGESSADAVQ
jgi:hypothetical protein